MTSEQNPWAKEAREAAKQTAIAYGAYMEQREAFTDAFMLGAKWHEQWLLDQLAQALSDKKLIPS